MAWGAGGEGHGAAWMVHPGPLRLDLQTSCRWRVCHGRPPLTHTTTITSHTPRRLLKPTHVHAHTHHPHRRLALLQVEAFYDGGLATALFNMPVLLAFTMGFILKAVGPGLVVPAMFQLQKMGLGRDQGEHAGEWRWQGRPGRRAVEAEPPPRLAQSPPTCTAGIPSTVVISASFDDIVAITGYSIFSSVAITGQSNVAWQIASGPLQIVFGIVGGLLGGILLGCTRLFSSRLKRLVGLYGGGLLLMYFLEYWNLLSGAQEAHVQTSGARGRTPMATNPLHALRCMLASAHPPGGTASRICCRWRPGSAVCGACSVQCLGERVSAVWLTGRLVCLLA